MALPGIPPSSDRAFAAHAGLEVPGKNGIPTGVDVKSEGLPKRSQRFGLKAGGLTGSEPVPERTQVLDRNVAAAEEENDVIFRFELIALFLCGGQTARC